jgi:hypothetical protein
MRNLLKYNFSLENARDQQHAEHDERDQRTSGIGQGRRLESEGIAGNWRRICQGALTISRLICKSSVLFVAGHLLITFTFYQNKLKKGDLSRECLSKTRENPLKMLKD